MLPEYGTGTYGGVGEDVSGTYGDLSSQAADAADASGDADVTGDEEFIDV